MKKITSDQVKKNIDQKPVNSNFFLRDEISKLKKGEAIELGFDE